MKSIAELKEAIASGAKLLVFLGILFISIAVVMEFSLYDESNDDWWRDRYFVVLTKHGSSLVEHGRYLKVEHYISVRYEDDGREWVKKVRPGFFYSIREGGRYTERVEKDGYGLMFFLLLALLLLGILVLAIGLGNLL